jgi:hypothetical protein
MTNSDAHSSVHGNVLQRHASVVQLSTPFIIRKALIQHNNKDLFPA